MPGKSSDERRALELQNARVMDVFEGAGFEHIAPDILQPADIFLERSGEEIRSRTYVFTDPGGSDLCLRPDLTVPACRYHLTHAKETAAEACYCYCGPAFRFTSDTAHPSEFGQAGIEWFGAVDGERAEATVLKLAIDAVRAAGLSTYRVTIGDLGLFRALLDDFDIPERWRRRLQHHFWRPQAFRDTLDLFTGDSVRLRTSISAHVDRIAAGASAESWVEEELTTHGLPLHGGRTASEIAARLAEKAADRSARPLTRAEARRINDYLAIAGAPAEAIAAFKSIGHGRSFDAATERFASLISKMERAGIATGELAFAAPFGRDLEYYTGFVFQIETSGMQIAGGGRYDDLLSDMGAPVPVPAVGCAIDLNRLLAAVNGAS